MPRTRGSCSRMTRGGVVEHVFGLAIERHRLRQERCWRDLRAALPVATEGHHRPASRVTQMGAVELSLLSAARTREYPGGNRRDDSRATAVSDGLELMPSIEVVGAALAAKDSAATAPRPTRPRPLRPDHQGERRARRTCSRRYWRMSDFGKAPVAGPTSRQGCGTAAASSARRATAIGIRSRLPHMDGSWPSAPNTGSCGLAPKRRRQRLRQCARTSDARGKV